MEVSRDRIKTLMDQVRRIHESPKNQARMRFWQVVPHERWEPALIRTLPAPRGGGKIPFVVEPALAMWSEILGFDTVAYYQDPLTYLTAQLEMKIYHAQHFQDDTYIDKSFRILFATLLEGTLMGMPFGFTREGHPWLDYAHPIVQSPEDVERLEPPDFRQSGIMPLVHRFYAEMTEALEDDFLVKFPDWLMGPFGVACELRGFDKFLMDLILNPEFTQQLLRAIVEARKAWQAECDRFLGVERTRGTLGNDDVYCPNLSPALYRDAVLPFEIELCEHYGGIDARFGEEAASPSFTDEGAASLSFTEKGTEKGGGIFYWHSCGDTTKLIDTIARIPVVDLFHCGPWTDVGQAARVWGDRGVALEVCVEPVDKVQRASPEEQRRYLREIVDQVPDHVECIIKVDSLEVMRDLATELAAIQSWIDAAREVLG